MKIIRIAALVLVVSPLALAGCLRRQPLMSAQPLPAGLSPAELQGYKAGVEAAQHDIRLDEPPDVRKHLQFREPPVPPVVAREYRQEFRAGYQQTIQGGPPPPGY